MLIQGEEVDDEGRRTGDEEGCLVEEVCLVNHEKRKKVEVLRIKDHIIRFPSL